MPISIHVPARSFRGSPPDAANTINKTVQIDDLPAPYLLFNDLTVDLAGRDIVIARQRHVEITLVVAQVEVNFATVIEDVHLAYAVSDDEHKDAHAHDPLTVLLRTHSASSYVHVGVDFYRGDLEPRGLQDQAGGRS